MAPPVAPCADSPEGTPDCANYCRVVSTACAGSNAQYEDAAPSTKQCLATCAAFEGGFNSDTMTNTVGCRTYHAYNSLLDPATHCSHAGPTGDGHCGVADATGNSLCTSYCRVVALACATSLPAELQNGGCEAQCAALSDAARDSHYTVSKGLVSGNTFSCRMLHAVRALAGDATECAAALGTTTCM